MKFLLGLTGSIGMGKSTTAQMFRDAGIPVWDADASVHQLYAKGGAAVAPLQKVLPQIVIDGAVSRDAIKEELAKDKAVLGVVESIVHPLLVASREAFIAANDGLLVFDIPLLFENQMEIWLDAVAVVTAASDTQKARVLARPGMTQDQLDFILERQMPDAEKRSRADYLIWTHTLDEARETVQNLIAAIRDTHLHA